MDKTFTNYFRVLQITASIGILTMVGCAHSLAPVKYESTASPTTEIQILRLQMNQARESQVDVLAASSYNKADEFLSDAKKYNDKGASTEKVFETIGYSKAYLNKAEVDSQMVRLNIAGVTEARVAAIKAGARSFPEELNNIDKELKSLTAKPEKSDKISSSDKSEIQTQYQNLELVAIKQANLGEAKNILNVAKKKGAEKITPMAYKQAVEKMNIAEKVIETDRHSISKIEPAVTEAKVSSMRVFTLLASEKNSRNQTPEQRAMTLEARDQAVTNANLITSEVVAESSIKDEKLALKDVKLAIKDEEIADQNANLAYAEGANNELLRREYDEKVVNNAAAQFDKSEADVYRQDGNLVIRLKKMNFASNRSDLPSDSIAVLNKVKFVMKDLAPESVMVEGHTDAIGDSIKNQKLSELRAQSVMKFFASEKYLEGNILDSTGFGYSKPLATNKTKEGRAQNRRVDIVIKTGPSKTL